MKSAENKYFKNVNFTSEQIKDYFNNAVKTLKIAGDNNSPEVKFDYAYKALIKAGITVIAAVKNAKVRSIQGHHIKIIETLSVILKDDTVNVVGNAMRAARNLDLYCGGKEISEKQSVDYYNFVKKIIAKAKLLLENK
ncbi:hypothetical protein KJ633_07810 [bacterium]|nr:hypothetical protein [bacterium]MBU3956351.1 hypothetical protein [bacterium]